MVTIGSARINENKQITGGLVGDQKQSSKPDYKGEVSLQQFYVHSKGWYVLRPKDQKVADKMAERMYTACNNPCLGYDQGISRKGVLSYGIDTTTPTGCDCGSLVRACVKEASGVDPGNFNTSNEVEMLEKTGLFNKAVSYVSGMELKRGDVLVTKTKGHTAIVTDSTTDAVKIYVKNQNDKNDDENAEWLWKYFKSCGLSDYAIAGIMGNLYDESHLRANNLQNSSEKKFGVTDDEYTLLVDNKIYTKEEFVNDKSGYGLAQWTSAGRKKGLYEFLKVAGKSIADLEGQAMYVWKEISENKSMLKKLKAVGSIKEASDIILHEYERPADQSGKVETRRAEYGKTFSNLFASKKQEEAPKIMSKVEEIRVKVDIPYLNIRKGPGEIYDKTGEYTGVGVFTITETQNNYGKLKSGAGWISMDYATRI